MGTDQRGDGAEEGLKPPGLVKDKNIRWPLLLRTDNNPSKILSVSVFCMIGTSVDEACEQIGQSELVQSIQKACRNGERVELPKGLRRDEAYRLAMRSTGAFSPRAGYNGIPRPVIEVRGGWAQALDYRNTRYDQPTLEADVVSLNTPQLQAYNIDQAA